MVLREYPLLVQGGPRLPRLAHVEKATVLRDLHSGIEPILALVLGDLHSLPRLFRQRRDLRQPRRLPPERDVGRQYVGGEFVVWDWQF